MESKIESKSKNLGILTLIRSGESEFNASKIFTGWLNPNLTELGIDQAKNCGKTLKTMQISFDICFTSILKRAILTWNYIAEEMDLHYIPVRKYWQLNARHYGALQGVSQAEIAYNFGDDQLLIWRRSENIPPPDHEENDIESSRFDPLFKNVPFYSIPLTESLSNTIKRVEQIFYDEIMIELLKGKNVVVISHQNTIRACIALIERIQEAELIELELKNCEFRQYSIDRNQKMTKIIQSEIKSTDNCILDKYTQKNKIQLNPVKETNFTNDTNQNYQCEIDTKTMQKDQFSKIENSLEDINKKLKNINSSNKKGIFKKSNEPIQSINQNFCQIDDLNIENELENSSQQKVNLVDDFPECNNNKLNLKITHDNNSDNPFSQSNQQEKIKEKEKEKYFSDDLTLKDNNPDNIELSKNISENDVIQEKINKNNDNLIENQSTNHFLNDKKETNNENNMGANSVDNEIKNLNNERIVPYIQAGLNMDTDEKKDVGNAEPKIHNNLNATEQNALGTQKSNNYNYNSILKKKSKKKKTFL